jgi:hypothetical protein
MATNCDKQATFGLASLASVNTGKIWENWPKITKNGQGNCQKFRKSAKNCPK